MKIKYTIPILALLLTQILALHLSKERNIERIGRQDETGDEETAGAGATATELPTNNHLIGTLAGVLSSILRSGVNGTNPFKFNLTEVVQRVQNFNPLKRLPIKLPFPGIFSGPSNKIDLPTPKNDSAPEYESILIPGKNAKKIIYEKPLITSGVVDAVREIQNADFGDDDYDEINSDKKTSIISEENKVEKTTATNFMNKYTTYRELEEVPTTTEYSLTVLQSLQTKVTELKNGSQEVTSSPYATTESSLSIHEFNSIFFWFGLYLNPATKIVKDAAKNVNLTLSNVIGGATAGVNGVVNVIPTFTEVLSNLVDYVEPDPIIKVLVNT